MKSRITLRPSHVVISEISTAADSQGKIRVMKTQMRSRWEIFESRRDKRAEIGEGRAKGSSDEEQEGYEQGGRHTAGTPNVM